MFNLLRNLKNLVSIFIYKGFLNVVFFCYFNLIMKFKLEIVGRKS